MQQVSWLAVSQRTVQGGSHMQTLFLLWLQAQILCTPCCVHVSCCVSFCLSFNMRPVRVEVIETGFWLTDNENTTSSWHSWDKCAAKFYQTRTPLSVRCTLPLFPIVLMETWYPRAITSNKTSNNDYTISCRIHPASCKGSNKPSKHERTTWKASAQSLMVAWKKRTQTPEAVQLHSFLIWTAES